MKYRGGKEYYTYGDAEIKVGEKLEDIDHLIEKEKPSAAGFTSAANEDRAAKKIDVTGKSFGVTDDGYYMRTEKG